MYDLPDASFIFRYFPFTTVVSVVASLIGVVILAKVIHFVKKF